MSLFKPGQPIQTTRGMISDAKKYRRKLKKKWDTAYSRWVKAGRKYDELVRKGKTHTKAFGQVKARVKKYAGQTNKLSTEIKRYDKWLARAYVPKKRRRKK